MVYNLIIKRNYLKVFLAGILSLIYFVSYSQENISEQDRNIVKGYIITKDKKYRQGFIIESTEKENSQFIYFLEHKNSQPTKLDENDIIVYGYGDKVYELMPFLNDSVFMQKLNFQDPILYYLNERAHRIFFVKSGNKFEIIPSKKDELQEYLKKELEDCKESLDNINIARYSKNRLEYIFKRNENCSSDRIPKFTFGVYTGLSFSKLRLNQEVVYKYGTDIYFNLEDIDYKWESGGFVNIFIDLPIDANEGKLFFHPEFQLSKSKYNFEKNNINFGFNINYYTVNGFLRYKNLDKRKALFIDFGLMYSSIEVTKSYIMDEYLFHQLANYLIGVGVGAGVSINDSFDIGFRSSYSLSHSMPKELDFKLLIGIEI